MPLNPIYLDHAATTPLLPEALAAMQEGFRIWANPSSPHAAGRAARAALEDARARMKAALGWTGEVVFTSGASEALAIGIGRAKAERTIVSAVEHDAVFRAAPNAEVLPIEEGLPNKDALVKMLSHPGRAVVAVQSINSETGTCLMPFVRNSIAEVVRDAGGLLLADCSQSAGKAPLPDADMIVISAHKLGGPIGMGALLVRSWDMISPSGGQERGYRQGTENLPGAMALAAALEANDIQTWKTTAEQRFDFCNALYCHGEVLTPGVQSSHIFAVAAERLAATAMLIRMDSLGFAISAGSACSSGTLKPSRVLQGFGIDPALIKRTVRISLGWNTTPAELDAFAEAWREVNR